MWCHSTSASFVKVRIVRTNDYIYYFYYYKEPLFPLIGMVTQMYHYTTEYAGYMYVNFYRRWRCYFCVSILLD